MKEIAAKTIISKRKIVLFVSTAIALFLLALEVVAWLLGYSPKETVAGYQESKFRASADFAWELVPDWNGSEGGGRVKINSIGLRDNEVVLPKPPGEKRALVLGDSVTFGYFVDQDEAWPRQLEDMLLLDGANARIVNAGVPGYSTFQEAAYLQKKGWALDPDVVIIGYCLNDAVERYTSMAEYGGKDVFLGVDTTARIGRAGRIMRKIAAYRMIADFLQKSEKRKEKYSVERLDSDKLPDDLEDAWKNNTTEIISIANDVKTRGKVFLVVIFPYLFQVESDGAAPFQNRMAAMCKSNGIECLDLLPSFRAHKKDGLFIDANHLSPRGHRLAAESVAQWMRDRGIAVKKTQ